jgi:hypothetical protein
VLEDARRAALAEIDGLRESGDSVARWAALEQARSVLGGALEVLAVVIGGVALRERVICGDALVGLWRELVDAFGGLIEGAAESWGGAGVGGPSEGCWRWTWVGGDLAVCVGGCPYDSCQVARRGW